MYKSSLAEACPEVYIIIVGSRQERGFKMPAQYL